MAPGKPRMGRLPVVTRRQVREPAVAKTMRFTFVALGGFALLEAAVMPGGEVLTARVPAAPGRAVLSQSN